MRVLVIRNSAMGDVALVVPCLQAFNQAYPDAEIVLLTRQQYHGFFTGIKNLHLLSPDYKGKHKGPTGLMKLYKEISATWKIDHVLDLHDVLRSKIIRTFFKTAGVPVTVINKHRKEKKALIKGKHKTQLPHTVQNYAEVFQQAGFEIKLQPLLPITTNTSVPEELKTSLTNPATLKIGIAPYAKHALKIWPEEYMVELMKMISAATRSQFYLLGGGEEVPALSTLANTVPDCIVVAGKYSIEQELSIISSLDFVIAMDSANMHVASLAGVKVCSIWGATDPVTGFGAWQQPEEYSIKIPFEQLECRPCTVYGKGSCKRKDFACMQWLTPQIVFAALQEKKFLPESFLKTT